MTPVEEEKTRVAGRPRAVATPEVTAATASSPTLPVKALELPEFTMIAAPVPAGLWWRVWPGSRDATGAVVERVKAPAMVVAGASGRA